VARSPEETLREAQRLLDAGMPFHAHEVFEDAWKSGPTQEEALWRGLAQLAVGLTHAARGNATGAASLLERATGSLARYAEQGGVPMYGLDLGELAAWARELTNRLPGPVDAAAEAPTLTG
jgi:predicted metal-dependent hydrolase